MCQALVRTKGSALEGSEAIFIPITKKQDYGVRKKKNKKEKLLKFMLRTCYRQRLSSSRTISIAV
jgi:hypothetical protein